MWFINELKHRAKEKHQNLFQNTTIFSDDKNYYNLAFRQVIKWDQQLHFPDLITYFMNPNVPKRDIPKLVTKLNVIYDSEDNVLRVKCKLRSMGNNAKFPILL